MNKSELMSVRGYLPEDKNFIFSTTLRGLYYGETHFSFMEKPLFMFHYHAILEALLPKYAPFIKVACLKDDTSVILGYAILNEDSTVLHWAFTKKSWRNIGIAKLLVPETVTTVTNLTKPGLSIAKKKSWSYNPFAI